MQRCLQVSALTVAALLCALWLCAALHNFNCFRHSYALACGGEFVLICVSQEQYQAEQRHQPATSKSKSTPKQVRHEWSRDLEEMWNTRRCDNLFPPLV